jgi:hypothetical protein
MTYADPDERHAFISGLRALADFLERNQDVPAPNYTSVLVFPPHDAPDIEKRREVDVIASRIGSGIEVFQNHYVTSRKFGPVEYRGVAISSESDKGQ